MPTLEYHGKPLFESNVINEFVEDVYGTDETYGRPLRPQDPYQRARGRIWTDFITSRIIPSFHRFLQFQPTGKSGDSDDEGLAAKRTEFLGYLKDFTREMDTTGPYFFGSEPHLIDFAFAPWAVRLWVFDHFKGGLGIPEEGKGTVEDERVWSRWRKWHSAIEGRETIKKTTSEKEHYLPIYQRYADDKAQSELAKATRKGTGVP